MTLTVTITSSGQSYTATLPPDAASYQPLPWMKRKAGKATLISKLGHAPFLGADGKALKGLRLVRLVSTIGQEIAHDSLLLWNGNVAERVERVPVESCTHSLGPGHSSTAPSPFGVYDGSFETIMSYSDGGAETFYALPGEDEIDRALKAAPPSKEWRDAFLLRAKPEYDDIANVGQHGGKLATPGYPREIVTLKLFGGMGNTCMDALLFNARQEGRRRLHYFSLSKKGELAPWRKREHPAEKIDGKLGLGAMFPASTGEILLLDGTRKKIVASADEQHFFRLPRHCWAWRITGNPLFWLASHGLVQYALGTPYASDPEDDNWNHRRAWIGEGLAHFGKVCEESPGRALEGDRADSDDALALIQRRLGTQHITLNTLLGWVFSAVGSNLEPHHGHENAAGIGATHTTYQCAVQLQMHASSGMATLEQAVLQLDSLARLRRELAPEDEAEAAADGHGGEWGAGAPGSYPYDAYVGLRDAQGAIIPAHWRWQHTGGGYSGTHTWAPLAMARAMTLYPWLKTTERMERLREFWERADSLRIHDKNLDSGEVLMMAALLGYRS